MKIKLRVKITPIPNPVNPELCDWHLQYRNLGFWCNVPYSPSARAANAAEAMYFGNRAMEKYGDNYYWESCV